MSRKHPHVGAFAVDVLGPLTRARAAFDDRTRFDLQKLLDHFSRVPDDEHRTRCGAAGRAPTAWASIALNPRNGGWGCREIGRLLGYASSGGDSAPVSTKTVNKRLAAWGAHRLVEVRAGVLWIDVERAYAVLRDDRPAAETDPNGIDPNGIDAQSCIGHAAAGERGRARTHEELPEVEGLDEVCAAAVAAATPVGGDAYVLTVAARASLAALIERGRTGRGQILDIAIVDALLSWTYVWTEGLTPGDATLADAAEPTANALRRAGEALPGGLGSIVGKLADSLAALIERHGFEVCLDALRESEAVSRPVGWLRATLAARALAAPAAPVEAPPEPALERDVRACKPVVEGIRPDARLSVAERGTLQALVAAHGEPAVRAVLPLAEGHGFPVLRLSALLDEQADSDPEARARWAKTRQRDLERRKRLKALERERKRQAQAQAEREVSVDERQRRAAATARRPVARSDRDELRRWRMHAEAQREPKAAWTDGIERIRARVTDENFASYFAPLRFARGGPGHLVARVSDPFFADWVTLHYGDLLADAIGRDVAIEVDEEPLDLAACLDERIGAAMPLDEVLGLCGLEETLAC